MVSLTRERQNPFRQRIYVNMIEYLTSLTLFGSFIGFAIITVVFMIILFITEAEKSLASAIFPTIVFGILIVFWSNIEFNLESFGKGLVLYLILGLVYAMIRTYFKGRQVLPISKSKSELKEDVFRWWLLFPISLILWITADLIKDLYNWVYAGIGNLFYSIFTIHDTKDKVDERN